MLRVTNVHTGDRAEVPIPDGHRPVRIAVCATDRRSGEVAGVVERAFTYEGADVDRVDDAAAADLAIGETAEGSAPAIVVAPVRGDADAQGQTFTYRCVAAHYREPVDLTEESLADAERQLGRLRDHVAELRAGGPAPEPSNVCHLELAISDAFEERFLDAIHDDLDTPAALEVIDEVAQGLGDAAGLHPGRAAAMAGRWAAMLGLDLR
jgi:hypothetical protein